MTSIIQAVSTALESLGVAVIVGGFLFAVYRSFTIMLGGDASVAYERMRSVFGRSVLLGLEILVAADLIRTVAVAPTVGNLLVLALLVAIRTFLSWSFSVEIEGVLPWRKREIDARLTRDAG